jgi:hypothetical protein
MRKTTLLTGLAAGYVLGTKAGRDRYEQIMRAFRQVRENPQVQRTTNQVQSQAGDLASTAKRSMSDKVGEKVPSRLGGRRQQTGTGYPTYDTVDEQPDGQTI